MRTSARMLPELLQGTYHINAYMSEDSLFEDFDSTDHVLLLMYYLRYCQTSSCVLCQFISFPKEQLGYSHVQIPLKVFGLHATPHNATDPVSLQHRVEL